MTESDSEERKRILETLCIIANDYEEKRNIYWNHYRSLRLGSHCLSIPLLLITTITGATSCVEVSNINNKIDCLPILIAIFGVSSAILTALQKYMRYAERSETSKYISKMYGLIATKIKGQIQIILAGHELPNKEDYDKFLDSINNEVQSLQLEIDVVPKALMDYEHNREYDISKLDEQHIKPLDDKQNNDNIHPNNELNQVLIEP